MIILVAFIGYQSAFAGVAEKKAVKEGDEQIAKNVKIITEKCGGTPTVKSAHASAESMTYEKSLPSTLISGSGNACASLISTLASLCSDADYKEEISKLKTISCTPDVNLIKTPFMAVKKDGANLNITHHPFKNSSSEAWNALKAAF